MTLAERLILSRWCGRAINNYRLHKARHRRRRGYPRTGCLKCSRTQYRMAAACLALLLPVEEKET